MGFTRSDREMPYGAFSAADAPFVVAVFTERFWGAFCRAVERPDFAKDARFATNELRARHRDALEPALEDAAGGRVDRAKACRARPS